MAAPPKITRALAVRLIARVEELYAAAAKAGHSTPAPFVYGDGMTRDEARALRQWAVGIPEIRAAVIDRKGHQGEAQAILSLALHFEHTHPQTADGKPAAWPASETLSPAMAAFARRDSNALDPAALAAPELEMFMNYAQLRNDPADFGENAAVVRTEINRLITAAEAAAETAPILEDGAGAAALPAGIVREGQSMAETPEREAAIAARDALWGDPQFQTAYRSPHINVRRPAINELLALNEKIVGTGPSAPAPRPSAIAPAVRLETTTPGAPVRRAPIDPAQLRDSLKGLNPSQRAIKLGELFGTPAPAAPSREGLVPVVGDAGVIGAEGP